MRRITKLVGILAVIFASLVGFPPAATAGPTFCGPDEGCSPCGPNIVIDGKRSRVEWMYC